MEVMIHCSVGAKNWCTTDVYLQEEHLHIPSPSYSLLGAAVPRYCLHATAVLHAVWTLVGGVGKIAARAPVVLLV